MYRTYLREGSPPAEHDQRCVHEATRAARRHNPSISSSVFSFLEDVLLLRTPQTETEREEHERFALRFQQLSGPVKAKAVEDSAFYRYNRLVCLNEVGNNPAKFGATLEEFHAQNSERARSWPLGMVTTDTHDAKRGEDTSARIAVLSEMPEPWRRALRVFGELAEGARGAVDAAPAPSRSLEYLFYQTLLGAWPLGWNGRDDRQRLVERMTNFMRKASKEAKQQTSWTSPNPAYDLAVEVFVRSMMDDDRFMDEMRKLAEAIAPYGAANGLSMTLLRLCSPGIPDSYQGSELWNQSLVDPDNRRPVDFAARRAALDEIVRERALDPLRLSRRLLAEYASGSIKLYVMHVALHARRQMPEVFLRGDYEPIPGNEHVAAFTRARGDERVLCAAVRLSYRKTEGKQAFALGEVWGDQRLRVPNAGRYRDLFTHRELQIGLDTPLRELFRELPVALLVQQRGRRGS